MKPSTQGRCVIIMFSSTRVRVIDVLADIRVAVPSDRRMTGGRNDEMSEICKALGISSMTLER
jgi:hypothetical protein